MHENFSQNLVTVLDKKKKLIIELNNEMKNLPNLYKK